MRSYQFQYPISKAIFQPVFSRRIFQLSFFFPFAGNRLFEVRQRLMLLPWVLAGARVAICTSSLILLQFVPDVFVSIVCVPKF